MPLQCQSKEHAADKVRTRLYTKPPRTRLHLPNPAYLVQLATLPGVLLICVSNSPRFLPLNSLSSSRSSTLCRGACNGASWRSCASRSSCSAVIWMAALWTCVKEHRGGVQLPLHRIPYGAIGTYGALFLTREVLRPSYSEVTCQYCTLDVPAYCSCAAWRTILTECLGLLCTANVQGLKGDRASGGSRVQRLCARQSTS